MRAALRTYWLLARAGFRRHSTYRLAILAGLGTNTVFGFIRASILLAALAAAGTTIGGYTPAQASSYVWWSQGLIGAVNIFTWSEVTSRVRSGDIAVDFARPLDVQLSYLAADLGRALVHFLPRGIPSLLIGALTFGVALPQSAWLWPAGLLSTALAVVISFAGRYAVNVAAFWLVETRGLQLVYLVVSAFFCGLYVPVHWFPAWLQVLANWSPFPSMLQTPVDLLSGRAGMGDALGLVAVQAGWTVGLLLIGHGMTRLGRRRLEVQGG